MLPFEELPAFAAVVCLGIFAQAATGFAAGLVIMPLMLWAGQGIPEAQAALIVSTLPQNLWGVYQYRATLEFRTIVFPASLRLAALPIGMGVLFFVDDFPVVQLRQIIGFVVILCVLLLIIYRPKPSNHLHLGWTWLAFLTSGFFQGCTGTGGPMMVLWVQAHDWSTKQTRAFLFSMYLISIIPAWGILYYLFDQRILASSLTSLAMLPALLVATWVGLRLGTWLGRDRLRRVTMVLLLLIGLFGLFSPWLYVSDRGTQAREKVEASEAPSHRRP
ncbi:MAG: sulfite exporter TauE/SafE family protein [Pirellulaceae bacterium]